MGKIACYTRVVKSLKERSGLSEVICASSDEHWITAEGDVSMVVKTFSLSPYLDYGIVLSVHLDE
jgi:hypothetical protein